jgi:hypothetical protein
VNLSQDKKRLGKCGDKKEEYIWAQMKMGNSLDETIHRKLKSLEILQEMKSKSGILTKLSKKVKETCKFEEAMLLRKMPQRKLEIRWSKNENINNDNMREENGKK